MPRLIIVEVYQIEVSGPINLKALEERIHAMETDSKRLEKARNRLVFIRLRYLGHPVPEACKICGITNQTRYNWQRSWNERGMDPVIPRYGGGRPAAITQEQKERFRNTVAHNMMTAAEAEAFLKGTFGLEFTQTHPFVVTFNGIPAYEAV